MKSKVILVAIIASMAICADSYAKDGLFGRMVGRGCCGDQAASCCDTPSHAGCCDLLDVSFRIRIGVPKLGGCGGCGHGLGCGHGHRHCGGFGGCGGCGGCGHAHQCCDSGNRGLLSRFGGWGCGCGCGSSHNDCDGCGDYGCGYRRPALCIPRLGILDRLRCAGGCLVRPNCGCNGHDYGCAGCGHGNYHDCGCSNGVYGWGGLRQRGWGAGWGCNCGCGQSHNNCGCNGGHQGGHEVYHNGGQGDGHIDPPHEAAPAEGSTTYRMTPAPNVDPSAFVIPNRRSTTGR